MYGMHTLVMQYEEESSIYMQRICTDFVDMQHAYNVESRGLACGF